jgi:prolipoprotein diacylglyceryltransferase
VTLTFLISYAVFRFIQEIFRGDELRGVYFNHMLSTAQITGIIAIILSLIVWVILKKKYPLAHPYPRYKPGEAPPLTPKETPITSE